MTTDAVPAASRDADDRAVRVWHTLEHSEVVAVLRSDPDTGLSCGEAGGRLERFGPNILEEGPAPSLLGTLLHQFRSPLIYILLVAAGVTVVLREYVDAGVIGAVLLLNAAIGFLQERKAEVSIRALMSLAAPHARVIRDGREWDLESRDLVVGDVVLLESGARVPADLRLISTRALTVDESLLTGESVPVSKRTHPLDAGVPVADRSNMTYAGTIVASGRGSGVVVATGGDTELGVVAENMRAADEPQTPLQQRMARLATVVGLATAVSAIMAFAIGVLLGEAISEMFLVGVALAVSAVPEGLPVVLTITLALGVRRMARRNAVIRRLPAVETLGSTSVIGSDKTGTLTENRMTVQEVWTAGRTSRMPSADEHRSAASLAPGSPLHLTLLTGVLTNEAQAYSTPKGLETHGDPTEAALLVAASRMGLEPELARTAHRVDLEVPFEPERRFSASIRQEPGGDPVLYVKGAPERVAAMCTRMLVDSGTAPMEAEAVDRAAREMAVRGLRVLGMALRPLPRAHGVNEDDLGNPGQLTFAGLQGMLDPPREGVRESVAAANSAGIRVVMITGDHALTARTIARELGIGNGSSTTAVTGVELDRLDDRALRDRVSDTSVFARVSPEHKLRVVRALREQGEVVAVTGDGVNDAPALKAADVGVAMGRTGTDVAREASDMVLTDDNFVSIQAAVEEGRITFDNLRKVTFFLLSSGAAEVLTILTALVVGWPLPLLPAQILWLNLVTNGLQDVALAFEPGEPGVLQRPPRSRREGVVSRLLWERTALVGVVMATGTLFMFWWTLNRGDSMEEARTAALTTMVLFQAFHAGNARSEHRSAFALNPFSNRFLLLAVVGALAVHASALYLPGTRLVLRVAPLPLGTWVQMALVAVTIVVAVEAHKAVRRRAVGQGSLHCGPRL